MRKVRNCSKKRVAMVYMFYATFVTGPGWLEFGMNCFPSLFSESWQATTNTFAKRDDMIEQNMNFQSNSQSELICKISLMRSTYEFLKFSIKKSALWLRESEKQLSTTSLKLFRQFKTGSRSWSPFDVIFVSKSFKQFNILLQLEPSNPPPKLNGVKLRQYN